MDCSRWLEVVMGEEVVRVVPRPETCVLASDVLHVTVASIGDTPYRRAERDALGTNRYSASSRFGRKHAFASSAEKFQWRTGRACQSFPVRIGHANARRRLSLGVRN